MTFFQNWKDKRVKTGKRLMFAIILLLCMFQGITLSEIFYSTNYYYEENVNFVLLKKIHQLCLTKSPSASLEFYSYNYNKQDLFIRKKSPAIDTNIHIPIPINEDLFFCQSSYDIRDTSVWSLDSLGTLLEEAFRYQKFIPPYTLTLSDRESGKVLDQYQYTTSACSLWSIHQEIPLGFLEHHLLTAEFIYPISHFWNQVWDKVITTLGLFILLILSTWTLFIQLRNEKKTSEYRKKFIHSLVHNLRSPIIFLKQQLECIEVLSLSAEERQAALVKCKERTSLVLKNIEQLLSNSVNAYGLVAQYESFDLTALIKKTMEAYQQNQPGKKVSITFTTQLNHPVSADPILLEGALGNLIGNSIKYSGEDTQISISCREEHKKLVITVIDNGFGIPAEEQEQIFRENYRGRKYMTDREHKGFGLGLYYVQAVVLAHRGHISVKSDRHSGCEFVLEIPQKNKKV